MQRYKIFILLALLQACSSPVPTRSGMEFARYFDLVDSTTAVVFTPSGGADTLRGPVESLVCMSSSYVGFLDALGAVSVVSGVSGLRFCGTPGLTAAEVGYDAALDYETILRTRPDYFLTYATGSVEPPGLSKLRELGVHCVILSEHLENHPLARAEYVKLFGALTGRLAAADSIFAMVRDNYLALVQGASGAAASGLLPESGAIPRPKVLLNTPYADAWFIPGGSNYMTRLIEDAGGTLLGAVPGSASSSIISLETAFAYAQEADFWLNPGRFTTAEELRSIHPLFHDIDLPEAWNNTLQTTHNGGNMFWETGPVRPDLILADLVSIFSHTPSAKSYYLPLK